MTKRNLPKRALGAALAALALGAGACGDLTVPDYNNPSIEELLNNPSPATVRAAASGLLIGARADLTGRTSYVTMTGIVGREAYILDVSDPRYVSELLQGPLTNSGAFGAGMWATRYANIRMGNILLGAVDQVGSFSEAEREALRGFVKTIQAYDFLLIINTRDVNGAPIDVNRGLEEELAPIASRAEVFQHIVTLLDEGRAHLQNGGGSFPFALSSGFQGFGTPESFIEFNRALRARVAVYMGDYAAALTALNASFVSTSEPLSTGVYHVYGTGSDNPNQLASPLVYVHPAVETDAEAGDDRLAKIAPADQPRSVQGVSSDLKFTLYPLPTSRVPLITNEELLLLRAEARWFTGDKPGAMADLNFVRQNAGGLMPLAQPATDQEFITRLLYERRYSLLFTGGHRWIDLRRFGRLGELPLDVGTHIRIAAFQVPEAECLARNLPSPCDLD
jgi:starch-binding outer membrane protein, SusD/RagB family